jgi:hypothetical protein
MGLEVNKVSRVVTYEEVQKVLGKIFYNLSPICREEILEANPHIFGGLVRKGVSKDVDVILDKSVSRECAWELTDKLAYSFPEVKVDVFVPATEQDLEEMEEAGIYVRDRDVYIIYSEKRHSDGSIASLDMGWVSKRGMELFGKIKELKEKRYEIAKEKHKLWEELQSKGISVEEWEKYEEPYDKQIEEVSREIAKLCLEYCKPYAYDSSKFASCMWECDNLIRETWEKLVPNWEEIVWGD